MKAKQGDRVAFECCGEQCTGVVVEVIKGKEMPETWQKIMGKGIHYKCQTDDWGPKTGASAVCRAREIKLLESK